VKTIDLETYKELGRRGEYYKLATDPEFWRHLNPNFTITENGLVPPLDPIKVAADELAHVKHTLKKDGYFQLLRLLEEKEMHKLGRAVTILHKEQWPTPFCMVYDEFWQLYQRLALVLSQTMGKDYKVLPNFWVYYIDNNDNGSGWAPHRDRGAVSHLTADGMPTSLTVWVAINDATPLNGCMYILPASRDPNYPNNLQVQEAKRLQDIRALPAPAGSVLSWNEMLFHWGARSSVDASEPRLSMALGFQRADITPRETPLLDPKVLPTFNQRLSMIGQHFFRFGIHLNLSQQVISLGEQLSGLGEPIQVWDTVPYPGDEKYKASQRAGTVKPMYGPSALAYTGAPSAPATNNQNPIGSQIQEPAPVVTGDDHKDSSQGPWWKKIL